MFAHFSSVNLPTAVGLQLPTDNKNSALRLQPENLNTVSKLPMSSCSPPVLAVLAPAWEPEHSLWAPVSSCSPPVLGGKGLKILSGWLCSNVWTVVPAKTLQGAGLIWRPQWLGFNPAPGCGSQEGSFLGPGSTRQVFSSHQPGAVETSQGNG